MIRLFVALIIPEEIVNQIIQIRQKIYPDDSRFKWEDKSKIHLTLKFIGDVKNELLEPIKNELDFLNGVKKINCDFEKFGFFFKQINDPRILWLGLKLDDDIFFIVDELNNRLTKFSISKEGKKFKAHLTLLRIKKELPTDFIDKFSNAEIPKIKFMVNEIALMESKLSPIGSNYRKIKKYTFK